MPHEPATSPLTVDRRLREEPVRLAEIRQAIPDALFAIDPLRSWLTLLRALCCVAAGVLVVHQIRLEPGPGLLWQIPALLVAWMAYGWSLVGLFVLGHECGHYTFSRRRWVNEFVGYLCFAPLANSFDTWRITHDHHHLHTQKRGQEIDWAAHLRTPDELAACTWRRAFMVRLGYALPFGTFLWIMWNTVRRGLLVRSMVPVGRWRRERRKLLLSNGLMAITMAAIYGGLWWVFGLWGMLKLYAIPASIAMITGALIITIQHASEESLLYEEQAWSPEQGQLVSTFDIRFPRPIEWMWCNINIHIPHHVSPRIPWYHLPAASAALKESIPHLYQEAPFGLRHLSWFARTPLLTHDADEGTYAVTPA